MFATCQKFNQLVPSHVNVYKFQPDLFDVCHDILTAMCPVNHRPKFMLCYIALHCIALHRIALLCTALHCIVLCCTALHYIVLCCLNLSEDSTSKYGCYLPYMSCEPPCEIYVVLCCSELHCAASHCTALCCTACFESNSSHYQQTWGCTGSAHYHPRTLTQT